MLEFRDLKKGFVVYLLDKQKQPIEFYSGIVEGVSLPRMRTMNEMQPVANSSMVVDVKVKIGDSILTFVCCEHDTRCINSQYVLSTEKEYIINDVQAIKRSSEDAVYAIDKHKATIARCEEILGELSPEYKESAVNTKKLERLSQDVNDLKASIAEVLKKIGGEQ